SPGSMRIKFLRILPETCASTWCLFSNSTLNMALGSGSTTTAITSIASSLLIQLRISVVSIQLSVFGCQLVASNQIVAADNRLLTTALYSVKITGPFLVTAMQCSKWAL